MEKGRRAHLKNAFCGGNELANGAGCGGGQDAAAPRSPQGQRRREAHDAPADHHHPPARQKGCYACNDTIQRQKVSY